MPLRQNAQASSAETRARGFCTRRFISQPYITICWMSSAARRWLEILHLDLSNSVSDESAVCYLAWDLDRSAPAPEDTEVLELRWLAFADALALALGGEITDAISVATLLRIDHMRLQRKLPPTLAAAMA